MNESIAKIQSLGASHYIYLYTQTFYGVSIQKRYNLKVLECTFKMTKIHFAQVCITHSHTASINTKCLCRYLQMCTRLNNNIFSRWKIFATKFSPYLLRRNERENYKMNDMRTRVKTSVPVTGAHLAKARDKTAKTPNKTSKISFDIHIIYVLTLRCGEYTIASPIIVFFLFHYNIFVERKYIYEYVIYRALCVCSFLRI